MFNMGSTYKFTGDQGTIIMKFLREDDEYYNVTVIGGSVVPEENHGQPKLVWKKSRILTTFSHELVKHEPVEVPEELQPRNRRTPDQIEIDKLLTHVDRTIKIERLIKQIDKALELGDEEAFMVLSKEYTKLKRKAVSV